jgi:transposase
MGEVITVGLDIAKSPFQVHGVDGAGAVVIRKRISRAKMLEFLAAPPRCLIGIEACPAAPLGSRVADDRSYREVDAAELCEGLPEAQQK